MPHSDWIQKEMELAQYYGKPVIGLVPWGQERVPGIVKEAAIEMIVWNIDTIVQAIRQHAL